MITVFVFSGDRQTQDRLCASLNEQDEFSAHPVNDIERAEMLIRAHVQVDALLVDWGHTEVESTRRVIDRVKEISDLQVPAVILVDQETAIGPIDVMGNGLDHYLNKPVSSQKMATCILDALSRHAPLTSGSRLSAAGIELICDEHRVIIDGNTVPLSPSEYRLLEFFMSNMEKVYDRQRLLKSVWGRRGIAIDERTVDVHIRRLRKILMEYNRETLIQTVRGFGYRFSEKP